MIARTLSRRIDIVTGDADIFYALRFLECDPDISMPPTTESSILIEPHRGYFRVIENDQVIREQITAKAVTETIHGHLTFQSLADFPTAPIVHAASLRCGGRRLLLVGSKGAGKTTLVLHLIQEGYDVEGDENVFVTPEGVIARPRGLRVKQSSAAFFPRLKQAFLTAPYYEDILTSQRIYNLDPRWVGARSWRIERGCADAIILLRPNHGGYSSLRPVSSLTLMRHLLPECGLARKDRGEAVGSLSKMIGSTKGFDLSLGDLTGAVLCLKKVSSELN